jgi:uncharacterized cupredoxin-like copper-binding protein
MADIFRMVAKTLTSTSNTTIAEMGTSSTAVVRGVTICNTSAAATATFDLLVVPSGTTAGVYMVKASSLATQATSQPLDSPIVLNAGDKLQAKASAANQIDITASYLESY